MKLMLVANQCTLFTRLLSNLFLLNVQLCVPFFQVSVSLEKNTDQGYRVKTFMHNVGTVKIKEQLGKYISALKEGMFTFLFHPFGSLVHLFLF